MTTLGEVAEFIMGQAPPGSECNTDGIGTPFVKVGEFTERIPLIREWTTKPLKLASNKDVFVCVVGATSGKINLGIESAIGRSVAAVRPRNGKLDQHYLYYFLRTWTVRLRSRSQGVAQGVITREMLSEIEIPLPPLSEQKRIAAILDKADAIRQKRREAIDIARTFEEALFFANFLGTQHSLPTTALDNLCSVIRDGVHKTPEYVTDGIPFLTVKNLTALPDGISFDECKYITPEDHAEFSKRTSPEIGDILVSKDGTIGVAREVTGGIPFNIFVSVALLKPRREVIHPTFLKTHFNMPFVQRQIADLIKGVAIRHLHLTDFRRLSIIVPPMPAQLDFVSQVSRIQRTEALQARANSQADGLFASLVQRAFRGEL